MDVFINKAHYPITVLGPGKRIGLWFQGCSQACLGCISRDTWHRDDSYKMPVDSLLSWCKKVCTGQPDPDGVTISGGEPFDQPEALIAVLEGLDTWRTSLNHPFDILCYSGLPFDELMEKHSSILNMIDAIIPGPYRKEQRTDKPWIGSSNQSLILLSDLAKERVYFKEAPSNTRQIQFVVEGSRIWFIGVPKDNDMEKLRTRLRVKGIDMGQCSWKA